MSDHIVIVERDSIEVIESASVFDFGGDTAPTYPARHLLYTSGQLAEVLVYSDPAATQLAERRVITRTDGVVTSIDYFDGAGTLLHTRTFAYSPDGVLTGVSDT